MAISNDQLQIWATAPASAKIQHTHEQIRKALSLSEALKLRDFEVYLQGSYANSTNTKSDSDVDIVVQLNSTFSPNTARLNAFQKSLFDLTYSNATYHWSDFRQDLINALTEYFGTSKIKTDGNKSLKLIGDQNLLNADVVPCLQHRNYNSFDLSNKEDYVEGMKFWTIRENIEIINYPRVHILHGEDKNAQHRTDEMYKDIVRVVKSIRRKMAENESFDPKIASSYFIECTVYNAPDGHFNGDHQTSLTYVFDFILRKCDADRLLTVSHQHKLFGDKLWQWNKPHASNFFTLAEQYYLNN